MEKSRGCQGSFFIFSIFVFFWLSESLVLQFFLINWKQGQLRNFTEGNSRNVIRIFLYFHLNNNYVIRIELAKIAMWACANFRTTRFCRWATRQWRSHQNTHKTFPSKSFSLRFFLMIPLFLLVGCNLSYMYIVDLFAALHELASASARTLLKLASGRLYEIKVTIDFRSNFAHWRVFTIWELQFWNKNVGCPCSLRTTEALKMSHFGIFSCSLQERIPSNNIKILWPRLMKTRIKLQSMHCVGHK